MLQTLLRFVALAVLALTPVAASAQKDAPNAADAPVASECQTPGVTISGDIPLPNVLRAMRERKVLKILAIGASSKGGGDLTDHGYFSLIESVLEKTVPGIDVKIIDRGISGELARDVAERLTTQVALIKPDLVLWQLGTHDALRQVPVDEFRSSVVDTLVWLRSHNVDVVLVGMHFVRRLVNDPHYQAIRAELSRIAEEQKVLRIGRYEAMQVIEQARSFSQSTQPNEFALTEAGYGCLAEYVVRAVTSGVFVRDRASAPQAGTPPAVAPAPKK